MENQRNLLLAVALCALLLIGWDMAVRVYYPDANETSSADGAKTGSADGAETSPVGGTEIRSQNDVADGAGGIAADGIGEQGKDIAGEAKPVTLENALAKTTRIPIESAEISGSINLEGARIDDVTLKTHRQTVKKDSGPTRIFWPQGTKEQQYAEFGWLVDGERIPSTAVWQAEGEKLSEQSPVTLRWQNETGQLFSIRFEIDEQYMIKATQTVSNPAGDTVVVRPFALLARTSKTASRDQWIAHSGPIGDFDDGVEFGPDYDDLAEARRVSPDGIPQWIGFTDIYWLSALIPQAKAAVETDFRSLGNDIFRADVIYDQMAVPAGQQAVRTSQLFAGAKESDVLTGYEDAGIANFGNSIDWGWFQVIAWPIWWLLTHLFKLIGNFGVAIILMTVGIRALLFPIAQKQFASMASMKAIQPKMKALQERYKDDKQKQQQEIMALYKTEKVNPLAGCLPMLIQIPIFFALYKVLILSIEMRHKPFVLWIQDLSAPDPAKILNLFGLLPFEPPGFLGIGVLAVMLGITMWMTFRLNPSSLDPMQKQLFAIMPWVLMFVMAPFAAGLLLYWVTNNILTLAQQTYLYSKHPLLQAQAVDDNKKSKA